MDAVGAERLRLFPAESSAELDEAAELDLQPLIRDYSGLLYRVALSLLRNPAEAEDVVQDVFVRVLEHRNELVRIVEIRPWLVRIAWNLATDRIRRIRPDQLEDLFAAGLVSNDLPVDEALAEVGRMRQVFRAIERLPKHERQALLLSAMDELSTAEIASILGKTESGVRALLFRARAHVRQRLGIKEAPHA